MRLSSRVMLSMLSVVAISGGVSTVIGGHLLWRNLSREAENRVRQDLNAAGEFYNQHLQSMAEPLRYTAMGERFSEALAEKELQYLSSRLELVRKNASLDILCATDANGIVIYRAHRGELSGDSLAEDRLVKAVLAGKDAVYGTILVPMETLQREAPALARKARIGILPTTKARPSDKTELNSGMMLCAAAAVRGNGGELIGVLRAGVLLNRNYDLVDQVQDIVFHAERYRQKLLGTATVFQDDVRVSTNVLQPDGTRAIGTRVSEEVYDCVFGQAKTWVGPAWVVQDWYISAYGPIHDIDGKTIGMLYVGVLKQKFDAVMLGTFLTFSLVALAGVVAAGLAAWRLSVTISRPVLALARATESIAGGDFSQKLTVESTDELNSLTYAFNTMTNSLNERDELLKERTRLQLTRSERLASIGRLAAGVAHEINNPLTGVLTFAHMLLKDAPEGSPQREDLQTIIDATTRCRDIVRGLLNFSRQSEPHKTQSDLNQVLRETISLIRNQASISRVSISEEFEPSLPPAVIDSNQIKEVAVNVLVNAIDASSEGGSLTVRTRPLDKDGIKWVEFEITDTGCGISPENLERVFDPFFTTKPTGKGTGLGLAISYGIV
ncbi:MAG: cache domain-containing protein, partial [Planctomycetes bacterium]|nr:cache domain-containing protein [Planctomycetota bacterium]